jgi:hypothetical protein
MTLIDVYFLHIKEFYHIPIKMWTTTVRIQVQFRFYCFETQAVRLGVEWLYPTSLFHRAFSFCGTLTLSWTLSKYIVSWAVHTFDTLYKETHHNITNAQGIKRLVSMNHTTERSMESFPRMPVYTVEITSYVFSHSVNGPWILNGAWHSTAGRMR